MERGQGSLVKPRLVVGLVRREQEAYAGMGSAPMTPHYIYRLTFVVDGGKYDSRTTNLPV